MEYIRNLSDSKIWLGQQKTCRCIRIAVYKYGVFIPYLLYFRARAFRFVLFMKLPHLKEDHHVVTMVTVEVTNSNKKHSRKAHINLRMQQRRQ